MRIAFFGILVIRLAVVGLLVVRLLVVGLAVSVVGLSVLIVEL